MSEPRFPRVASFKTAAVFRQHLADAHIDLAFDDTLSPAAASPLAAPLIIDGARVGNRFCILPMEGWDGTLAGEPSDLTRRRWRHFGVSGAKLIWGGEAIAVSDDGRANPNQLVLTERTQTALAGLREALVAEHVGRFGARAADDLYVGLQLTHSGRFARPHENAPPAPLAAYAHPLLDARFAGGVRILTDDDLARIADVFVRAARMARDIGFQFVDVKHCHGYLLHELLGARTREGRYGGSLENRTRFLRDVIDGIRAEAPGLAIGVRLSVFDSVPYRKGVLGRGEPEVAGEGCAYGFGLLQSARPREAPPSPDTAPQVSSPPPGRPSPESGERVDAPASAPDLVLDAALTETRQVLAMLQNRGVRLICATAGSPYYCPHIQRPAAFPPIDGYEPPEDPLRGVARQIDANARLKKAFSDLVFVGSAYSYLQEWLPNVAQYNVRNGLTDFVGIGRVVLSYPELPADVLEGRPLRRKVICRTFSDCTTGPRTGLVSGCYPLDPFYTQHPHAIRLKEVKAGART